MELGRVSNSSAKFGSELGQFSLKLGDGFLAKHVHLVEESGPKENWSLPLRPFVWCGCSQN